MKGPTDNTIQHGQYCQNVHSIIDSVSICTKTMQAPVKLTPIYNFATIFLLKLNRMKNARKKIANKLPVQESGLFDDPVYSDL